MKNSLIFLGIFISFAAQNQNVIPVVQTGHAGKITHICWDKSMRYIASSDVHNYLVITDFISGKQFHKSGIPCNANILGIAFDSNMNLNISTEKSDFEFNMYTLEYGESNIKLKKKKLPERVKINGAVVRQGMKTLFNRDAYTHFTYVAKSPVGNIVIAGDEKGLIYFCDDNLSVTKTEKIHLLEITDIAFTPDGSFVAIASADRSISVWRMPAGDFERRIIPRSFNISALESHEKDNIFAFGDELGIIYKLIFESDKIRVKSVDAHNGRINDLDFSSNPAVIASAGGDNRAAVVDFENSKVLQYFLLHPNTKKAKQFVSIENIQSKVLQQKEGELWYDENVYSVAVSPDSKSIAYSGGKWGINKPILKISSIGSLRIDSEKENRRSRKQNIGLMDKSNSNVYQQLYFENDKIFWGLGEEFGKASSYETKLTGYNRKSAGHSQNAFSSRKPHENFLATEYRTQKSQENDYLIKYNPINGDRFFCKGFEITRKNGSQTLTYQGHLSYINDITFIKSKNYLISCADDASIIIWDYQSGKKIMSVFVVDNGRLVYINPENYYMATGDAISGVGFNYKGRIFPPEQFDLKYNRPDIIMSDLGIFAQDIIDLYYSAYLKRLSRMGFTEEILIGEMNLPELHIMNIRDLSPRTSSESINLIIKAIDEVYNIDRINVYVNDVPLYGTRGLSMREKNSKEIVSDIEIPLSAGRNIIHVSAHNFSGVESLKEEIEINFDGNFDRKPDIYLISLAVNNYDQEQYNLQYTVNDGKSFVNLFSSNRRMFNNIHVDTFYNHNCTRDKILPVKEKLMNTHVDDYVFVHIAGHGLLDENLDFYFATRDIDFHNPSKKGLRYDEIEDLLDGIPARNKLLLMDACHSGEVDRDSDFAYSGEIGDDQRGVTLFQSAPATTKPVTGLKNSFELMRIMFADLKKGTGTVVISAASGSGYALELDELQMGVFTYSLVQGLNKRSADINNDKKISVSELRSHILKEVERLSNGRQQATSRSENLINDFNIW